MRCSGSDSSGDGEQRADQAVAHPDPSADESRREAIRKIARFGAYTAPALLVMLTADKAVALETGSK